MLKCPQLSPLQQRRWQIFKAHKRGYYALWLFCLLFFISLFAEFIANDKPLLIYYDNQILLPIFNAYPETKFDGDFKTEADYTDPFVEQLILKKGWMLWPPVRFSYDTIYYELNKPAPAPPSKTNWLGTDDQARDVFTRVLYGFRTSVLFGLALTFFSSIIGITVGAIQGYFGGWVDLVGQRLVEIWCGLPVLFILIILSAVVTPNFGWLLLIMVLFSWTNLVSVVRAEFLKGRNALYVKAARSLGMSNRAIMFKHILPNAMVATLTFIPFILSGAIVALTSLDFIGFGLPPGSPSLGELLSQGKNNLHSPWLGLTAFTIVSLQLTLLIMIGEAVRDAFDPGKQYDGS